MCRVRTGAQPCAVTVSDREAAFYRGAAPAGRLKGKGLDLGGQETVTDEVATGAPYAGTYGFRSAYVTPPERENSIIKAAPMKETSKADSSGSPSRAK
jgi:hypothetical protein